ncbi:MAG: DUF4215 domain-containing protein [Myxococcales bacterium]|nr:DUF4215 domain-containing protein [Myxococcales bacterium]
MAWRCASLALAMLVLGASGAQAQAPLITGLGGPAGFGIDTLPPDDDGSSAPISLTAAFPSGLEFFGTRYPDLFVNINGNVSFAMPLMTFTPMPFPVASQPMIAAWWGDVDTRGVAPADENAVYWSVEPGRFIATWYRVGYFDSHVDLVNSFQIVLTDESAVGAAGDFDVEIRYEQLEWTTGDASDGVGGLGGTPAQAGFDAGNTRDFLALPGSLTSAVLALETTSNVGIPGVWRFQIRSGAVTICGNGVLEAGEDCDDGNTTPGDGCGARCNTERVLGAGCLFDPDCRSGFCVTGVCCDSACVGDCEFCAPATGRCSPELSGTPCRDFAGVCDAIEVCDGVARSCPPDLPEPDGTSCTDEDACNGDEVCFAGSCVLGSPPDCDDLDPCTADACDPTTGCLNDPIPGCMPDAGPLPDGGPSDGGGVDGGGFDAGTTDAGAIDAGTTDAGVSDAGTTDAGGMDAGVPVDAALDPGTPRGSGIACAARPGRAPAGAALALFALGLVLRRRKR